MRFARPTCTLLALLAGCTSTPKPSTMASTPRPMTLSVASTSPAILPPELKFSGPSMRAIQDGTKTATVRKGARSFPAGVIKATCTTTESMILQNVTATAKKMSELTEADAKANGSDSLDELKDDLSRDYPGIQPDDVVTVINFKPAPPDPGK